MPQRASSTRNELKPTQKRVLAALSNGGPGQLTRGEYEQIAGVSRSQAAYDLAELVEAGILERLGSGRATRYRLLRRDHPGQRRWTRENIRAGLDDFCAGRETWPSASEFKAAGRSDLYVAASRYGGIASWAAELGFDRSRRPAPQPSVRTLARAPAPSWELARSWRPRFRWAVGRAVLAAALVAAVGAALFAAVFSRHDAPARDAAAPQAAKSSSVPPAVLQRTRRTRHVARAPASTAKAKPKQAKAAQRHVSQSGSSTPAQPVSTGSQTELASERLSVRSSTPASTSTPSSTSTTRHESTPPPTTSSPPSGPAPMAPPPGGDGPGPLPPPRH